MPFKHYLRPLTIAVIAAISSSSISAAQCTEGYTCKIYDGNNGLDSKKNFGYLDVDNPSKHQVIVNTGKGLTGKVIGAASDTAENLLDNHVIINLLPGEELKASTNHSVAYNNYGHIVGASAWLTLGASLNRNLSENSVSLIGQIDSESQNQPKPIINGGAVTGAFVNYQNFEDKNQTLTLNKNSVLLDNVQFKYTDSGSYQSNYISGANVVGGAHDGTVTAEQNTVEINNSTVDANGIYAADLGGMTSSSTSKRSVNRNNQITITNSNIALKASTPSSGSSAFAELVAVSTSNSLSEGNVIDISNSTLKYDIDRDSDFGTSVGKLSAVSITNTNDSSLSSSANRNGIKLEKVDLNVQDKNTNSIFEFAGVNVFHGNAEENYIEITNQSTLKSDKALRIQTVNFRASRYDDDAVYITSNNRLLVNGLDAEHPAKIVGGYATYLQAVYSHSNNDLVANNNEVDIKYAQIGEEGGDSSSGYINAVNNTTASSASNNRISISNSIINNSNIVAVDSGTRSQAENNTVTIVNSTINNNEISTVDLKSKSEATNNKISVSDSTINTKNLIVAKASFDETSRATENILEIGENVKSSNSDWLELDGLYVGLASGIYSTDMKTVDEFANAFSGNTLSLASRVKTGVLQGIQHYQFHFNDDIFNSSSTPYITVTGDKPVLLHHDSTDANNSSTVTLSGVTGFEKDQEVVLIDSAQGFVESDGTTYYEAGADLSWLKKDFTSTSLVSLVRTQTTFVSADDYELGIVDNTDDSGKSLVLVWDKDSSNPSEPGTDPDPGQPEVPGTDPEQPDNPGTAPGNSVNDQTNSLVESSLSTMATAFAADDLFVDAVLRSRSGTRDGLFAAARAGRYSYDTNTRLETNVVSGLVGYAASVGESNVGAFLEMGHASYDSRLHSQFGDVRGQGKHNYAGVGIFADLALPLDGWRATGYVKAGSLNNDFNASIAGADAGYDKSSAYWGAHLGTHYDIEAESFKTRVFFSYFYDGRESVSYDIAGTSELGSARIDFDTLNAHRVQVGGMFEYKMSEQLRPYLGLTFEQIVSAEAKGTATDAQGTLRLNSSDMEGSTGILSAGWTYVNEPGTFECELGINGYAGTRNGVSGQLQGTWRF